MLFFFMINQYFYEGKEKENLKFIFCTKFPYYFEDKIRISVTQLYQGFSFSLIH